MIGGLKVTQVLSTIKHPPGTPLREITTGRCRLSSHYTTPHLGRITLDAATDEWEIHRKKYGKIPRTLRGWQGTVVQRLSMHLHEVHNVNYVGEVRPHHVAEHYFLLANLAVSAELSQSEIEIAARMLDPERTSKFAYADRHLIVLKRFFIFCWSREYVDADYLHMQWHRTELMKILVNKK